MEPIDMRPGRTRVAATDLGQNGPINLRLYVAHSTPNSVRATSNLTAALATLNAGLAQPLLEIIDVFTQPKRAIKDGVIVTPTLIGTNVGKRVVLLGDLSDQTQLAGVLLDLLS